MGNIILYLIYMHRSKFKPMLEYTILYALGIFKRLNIGQEIGIYKEGNINYIYTVIHIYITKNSGVKLRRKWKALYDNSPHATSQFTNEGTELFWSVCAFLNLGHG